MSGIDVASKNTIKEALGRLANVYEQALQDGPHTSYMGIAPPDSQIAMTIRQLRAGDAALFAAKPVFGLPDLQNQVERLGNAMLGMAGRTLVHARPDHIVSETRGVEVITDLTGYKPGTNLSPLTDLMISKVMGKTPPYSHVWQQIEDAGQALAGLSDKQHLAAFVSSMDSIEDDNDMAVACSRSGQTLLRAYHVSGDSSLGSAAYQMALSDSRIMGGDLAMHMICSAYLQNETARSHPQPRQ